MMENEAAKEARRQYMREYRAKNRGHILARQREYYRNNREKYREYQNKFWEKKAKEASNN